MKIIWPRFLILALLIFAPGAQAQQGLRIVAVVNDDVISAFDLGARLSLVILSSNLDNKLEIRNRLAPQVLRNLISEKLKLQEAKRLNIRVTGAEIRNALAQIEKQNKLPLGGLNSFLARNRIDKAELVEQVEAEIIWIKVINRSLRPKIEISDEEVDEKLAEARADEGKLLTRVAEIFIAVERPEKDVEARLLGERLIQQLKGGARFPALARSFSQNPSAATGGDLGWIKPGQLDPRLEAALSSMKPTQITPLIRTATGYHILMLINRRTAPTLSTSETTVTLQQIFLPLSPNPAQAEIDQQKQRAKSLTTALTSCAEMDRVGKETGSPMSGSLGKMPTSNLPDTLRSAVRGLVVGRTSEPLRTKDGIIVLMVCSKETSGDEEDDRTQIENALIDQRLAIAATRRLNELRRAAFVDIRI